MNQIFKALVLVLLVACLPFKISAQEKFSTLIVMSYYPVGRDGNLGDQNSPHRMPAFKKSCPTTVFFDEETLELLLDNTTNDKNVEYAITTEAGEEIFSDTLSVNDESYLSLDMLEEGTYYLQITVGADKYIGIISI